MDVRMTPEIKEFLLSRVPFSPAAVVDFIPETFNRTHEVEGQQVRILPEEFTPVFKLRSLKKDERDKLITALQDANKNENAIKEICRKAIVGWTNLFDLGTNEPYEYKADVNGGCDKDSFGYLPIVIVSEIALYIARISGLTNADKLGL